MPSQPSTRKSPPETELARELMRRIDAALCTAADPEAAVAMRAYLRDQFDFLGLKAPRQRALTKQAIQGLPAPGEADLRSVALACWDRPEREFQHVGCDLLRRHVRVCGPGFLATAEVLITHRSWWDTVDTLAAHVVGPLVRRHAELLATMDQWSVHPNLWLARTAILHQLTYKTATDADRLFEYCRAQAGHRDFFIRKAIGWALREYARTAPAAVRAFVTTHRGDLSPLSQREALKHL